MMRPYCRGQENETPSVPSKNTRKNEKIAQKKSDHLAAAAFFGFGTPTRQWPHGSTRHFFMHHLRGERYNDSEQPRAKDHKDTTPAQSDKVEYTTGAVMYDVYVQSVVLLCILLALTNSSGQTHIASTAPAMQPDVNETTGFELFFDMPATFPTPRARRSGAISGVGVQQRKTK